MLKVGIKLIQAKMDLHHPTFIYQNSLLLDNIVNYLYKYLFKEAGALERYLLWDV